MTFAVLDSSTGEDVEIAGVRPAGGQTGILKKSEHSAGQYFKIPGARGGDQAGKFKKSENPTGEYFEIPDMLDDNQQGQFRKSAGSAGVARATKASDSTNSSQKPKN